MKTALRIEAINPLHTRNLDLDNGEDRGRLPQTQSTPFFTVAHEPSSSRLSRVVKKGTDSFPNADRRKKPVANGQPDGYPHATGGSSCVQELSFLLFREISSFIIPS